MAGSAGGGNSGPRSLAALLSPVTRAAFRKRSPAAARIMSDWVAIVGPDLASRTVPRKFAAGILTLGCDGPTALELQHVATRLAERINVQLGEAQVRQVRFVNETVAGPAPRRRAAPVVPDNLPEGELATSLARLAAAIAARDGPL